MKYFGFIKEHDDYKYSVSIKDLIKEKNTESPHREEVIEYLEKGNLCVAWMGGVEDAMNPRFNEENYKDNDFMDHSVVDTDGEWFWPEYIDPIMSQILAKVSLKNQLREVIL